MHILFLTDNFPPEVNAPASRTYEHCREWARAGHQVTVITCAPNFPAGRVYAGYRNRFWQQEQIDGICVIRVWSYITRNEGFLKRTLDYMSFMLSAFWAGLLIRRFDVIVGTSPQFFTACAAYGVSVVRRRPWVFELRDLWPESIRTLGAIRRKSVLNALEKIELFLYRKATAVVSVTNAFKHDLTRRGIEAGKISVVTNGVDLSRFAPMPKDRDLVQAHRLEGMFVAGYIGTHGLAHGLDTLVEVAAFLQDSGWARNIRILMLGDGAQRATLEKRARNEGLQNILFIDSVPKDQVARYWSLLDVSIIHLRKSELFKTVIPSKLFECMGMGIPVLHAVEGESAEIVKSHDVGLPVEPENAAALVEGLRLLFEDRALRDRLAANGPKAAAHFKRDTLASDMLAVLEKASREPTDIVAIADGR